MSIIDDIRHSFREGSTAIRLIYINAAVFIVLRLAEAFMRLAGLGVNPVGWLAMPTEPASLIFRPWTVVTYMFTHYDIVHIIFNMLCLHWFGQIFVALIGDRLVLRTYIIGGLAGAVLCLLLSPLWSYGSLLLGASAAVLALLFAVSVYEPDYRVHLAFVGEVRLKYYALFFVVIDVVSIAAWDNAGGHTAHLGGALAGAYLALRWKKYGLPQGSLVPRKLRNLFQRKPRFTVIQGGRPLSDEQYNRRRHDTQQEIDRILDKIKASGYDSLTQQERQTLFDQSKK